MPAGGSERVLAFGLDVRVRFLRRLQYMQRMRFHFGLRMCLARL